MKVLSIEAAVRRCSLFVKMFAIFPRNSQYWSLLLIKLQAFSCEYCEMFNNNFIHRAPPVTAFVSGHVTFYCPVVIMEKVSTADAVFSLVQKSLTAAPIFLVQTVVKKDGSFACKPRRAGEGKIKVHIFIYKIFTESFFKRYIATAK